MIITLNTIRANLVPTLKMAIPAALSFATGYCISEWQNRAKPELIVNSIGFTGDEIELDNEFIKSTSEAAWISAYEKYESYAALDNSYKKLSRLETRLNVGIKITEEWLENHQHWKNKGIKIDIEDLKKIPYCSDIMIGSTLLGSMRRSEIESPPNSLESVNQSSDITDLYRTNNGWELYLQTNASPFTDYNAKTDKAKASIELMAKSFSHGDTQNIYYYMDKFVAIANKDLLEVIALKKGHEKVLHSNAHIKLSVSIYNSGNSPVFFRPYMALVFQNETLKNYPIKLKVEKDKSDKAEKDKSDMLLNLLSKKGNDSTGKDVITPSYLPESVGSEYTFIQPNSSEVITLSSIEPFGRDEKFGKNIVNWFKTNGLKSEVIAISGDGDEIHSKPVIFGEKISEEDEKLIDKATQ